MKVKYSHNTDKDFQKHATYLQELKRSNPKKYAHLDVKDLNKTLKYRIQHKIEDKDEHQSSIFPDKYKYGNNNYKMHIDTKSHYVVFYKIIKPKRGDAYISIEKCTHSRELNKDLEEKGIKPLKNADPELLLDYTTVEKEDKVKDDDLSDKEREEYKEREAELKDRIAAKSKKKSTSGNNDKDTEKDKDTDKDKETEATDPKTGKKVKLTPAPPGPRGGPRVKINGKGKIRYRSEFESKTPLVPITEYLQNSKMKSLTDYIQEYL